MDTLRDKVISEANKLVGQEGVGSGDHPTTAGLKGEAAGNFLAAQFQRGTQQVGRVAVQVRVRKVANLFGDGTAIDDRSPVGDQSKAGRLAHQPSAASRFKA